MTERPILFSGPMVRAIRAGRKTQTRRVVKPQPIMEPLGDWAEDLVSAYLGDSVPIMHVMEKRGPFKGKIAQWPLLDNLHTCPYGAPGDRLWVREQFACIHHPDDPEQPFRVSHDIPPEATAYWTVYFAADSTWPVSRQDRGFPWRPSIHMPRWASRITLELTSVRVERLITISMEDAIAEGIERVPQLGILRASGWKDYMGRTHGTMDPVASYSSLWASINGPDSWKENPWVWVIEFQPVNHA